MSERMAQFLQGVGSVLTFGAGLHVTVKAPTYHDREAFTKRSVDRDLCAIAQDLVVANREEVAKVPSHGRDRIEEKKKG